MKTAIVHLSDIHMDVDWNFENDTKEIANQINSIEVDKVIIAISGDLTQSGSNKQFDLVYCFLDNVISKLKSNNQKTDVVFVPGNHDIEYADGEKRKRNVLSKMTDIDYFNNIETELKRFNNYYSFCELFYLPSSFDSNSGFKVHFVDCDIGNNLKARFYLLNNVTFSTYKAENNENSCGVVNIPNSLFESISLEPNSINFLMMHFPIHYLNENSYARLKKAMPMLSYILCGHIHQNENIRISSDDYLCSVSVSPALHRENIKRLGMSILVIDSETKEINRYSYNISDRNVYVRNDKSEKTYARVINGINPLLKNEDYCKSITYSIYDNLSLNDYYVFPELYSEKNGPFQKITNIETLVSCLSKKRIIIIKGLSQSGKTTFIRKLFFDLDEIGIPILFDFATINSLSEQGLKDLIRISLSDEYHDSFSYSVFQSTNISERIALIDNYIIDNNSKSTLSILSNYFGKIIIASSGTSYGMTEIENVAMKSVLDDSVAFYELRPMFKQKRYELIEKRYRALLKGSNKNVGENEIKVFYQNVQMILDKYVGSDANYPYFINKVVLSVATDSIGLSTQNNRMYSKVYETYVNTVILGIFQDQGLAMVAIELLKIIANSIIKEKQYRIDYCEFHKIVGDFFKNKNIRNISQDEIVAKLLEKRVLIKTDGNDYAFGSSDFLAYFAARFFSDLLNDDFDNNKDSIVELLNDCCDDVFSKYLLFVVSLATKKTALYLIDLAEQFVSQYEDYEIVDEVLFLNDKEFEYLHQLTKKDRQELRERISEKEAKRYERERAEYKKSVDKEKETISDEKIKLFCKCSGLLDIISAMLPDLKVIIDGTDQDRCIKIIYKLPLILYRIGFGELSDNYESISSQLVDLMKTNGRNISLDTAKNLIIDYCRAAFLAIVDHTVRRAHTNLTEKDLERKDFSNNDTKKLIRLMSSMHDSNAEETFEKYSKDYFLYFKSSPFAKNCISLMVRNYVSWYLSEDKAITKKDFLKLFLKDNRVVKKTIDDNLKDKKDSLI